MNEKVKKICQKTGWLNKSEEIIKRIVQKTGTKGIRKEMKINFNTCHYNRLKNFEKYDISVDDVINIALTDLFKPVHR